MKSGEGLNPYDLADHKKDCPESIWANSEELIDAHEIVQRKCEACKIEYNLWTNIIKHTADETTQPVTLYGDLAMRGFDLVTKVIDFGYPVTDLSASDYQLLEIVYAAVKRRESFRIWNQNEEIKKANQS